MKPRNFCRLAILFFSLAFVSTVIPQTSDSSTKPFYSQTGSEATVFGSVTVIGKVPKALQIDMTAEPVCIGLEQMPTTQWIIANGDKLQNVLVYVKSADVFELFRFTQPESAAVLSHRNCQYSPHILGIRVGQRLQISNLDSTTHNTHPTPAKNPEWNQSQPSDAPAIEKSFGVSEVAIPFKDNQHPWEKAYVGVFNHPFFAVTDELGNFRIAGLPPGRYTFVAWHERLGSHEFEVILNAGEQRSIDFSFKVPVEKD
jgi:hypothetical protein